MRFLRLLYRSSAAVGFAVGFVGALVEEWRHIRRSTKR